MKIIHLICAARPNFMKIAPLYRLLAGLSWCKPVIVHTGQHYDYNLSQAFFDDLGLPNPDYYLGVGSGTHAEQTAQTMIEYEELCLTKSKPDLVVVVGDVNATLSCTIAAKKIHLPVAHLEAGLRSLDRTMPEEINRMVTDCICDYHWTPSQDANLHLENEGVSKDKISMVGNIMIDAYCLLEDKIVKNKIINELNLIPKKFVILTLHRPTNVDNIDILLNIMKRIEGIQLPVVFPVHPRTKKNLDNISKPKNLQCIEPLGYIEFMSLVRNSAFVISDSGGIQEETTYLNIPCFTLRDSTERPITITMGSNQLITVDNMLDKIQNPKTGVKPPLWDGKTAKRVVEIIENIV